MEAGGDPARFWSVTPREAAREMQAMMARRRADHDQTAWLAWHIEALARTKKLPPLRDMLSTSKRGRRERQDPETLAAAIKLAFGYPGDLTK